MTLSIALVWVDGSNRILSEELISGPSGLAGTEDTRVTLWSSAAVVALGARYLPVLASSDLYVAPDEIGEFSDECRRLLENGSALAIATGYRPDYVIRRLANFVGAARLAKDRRAGLLID